METAVSPILGRMVDDHSILLDAPQRWAIAAWSVKTAMALHSTVKARPLFYTPEEHQALMFSSAIPLRTFVWLGRFIGTANLGGITSDVTVREVGRSACPSRVTTLLLGHIAIQIFTVHATAEYRDRTIQIGCAQGPWDDILIGCWPTNGRNLYWPPALAFHENIEAINFLAFADRHLVGAEVPL
jgi:hypothetical protein